MTGIRDVPMPKGGMRGRFGHCRWCGEALLHHDGKRAGEINLRRGWHDGRSGEPDCLLIYYLHSRRDHQFDHVKARDGLGCWDCKRAPERWVRGRCEVTVWQSDWPRGLQRPRYVEVRRSSALEVEHEVPLWSVAHLPDDERRAFYGPNNLRLRCPDCHAAKTAAEATERAARRKVAA